MGTPDHEAIYLKVVAASPGKSVDSLAKAIGDAPNAVSNWRKRGIPKDRAKAVEILTGISVKELRPNDWHRLWPDVKPARKRRTPATEAA